MKRILRTQTPVDANEQDGLLLYYNYLQNALDQSITPEEDPMLRFMPTSLGQKNGDVERYQFSVGGYTERGAPRTPSQQTYDLWTSAFTSTDAEQNTQFYGVLREEPRLTVNLPRQLMREQERTYRRVISSPAVLNRLDDIQVFTNRSGLPNDAPYPPRRGGGPTVQLTTETRRYITAIFNEPIYPSTITFDQVWDGDSSYFYDVILKFMWENYNPDMAGRNSFATLKDLTVQLADGYVGTMRDDARPHTLRAKPLYRAIRTFFPNTEDLVNLLRTDPPSSRMEYSFFKTKQTGPLVSQGYTKQWLDLQQQRMSVNMDYDGELIPNYVYFRREYEQKIAEPNLPEAHIPNIYVYSLAATSKKSGWGGNNTLRVPSGIYKEQRTRIVPGQGEITEEHVPGRVMRSAHTSQEVYLEMLSLGRYPYPINPEYIYGTNWTSTRGELNPNQRVGEPILDSQARSVGSYFDQYAKKVNLVEQGPGRNYAETIIVPSTDYDLLVGTERNKRKFPMHVEIKFFRDSTKPRPPQNENNEQPAPMVPNETADIIQRNRLSTTILSALKNTESRDKISQIETTLLRPYSQNSNLSFPLFWPVNRTFVGGLKFYDFADIMTYGNNNELIESLVLTEKCLEGATGEFIRVGESSQEAVTELQALAVRKHKTYEQILSLASANYYGWNESDETTTSEAIGYKIEKRSIDINQNRPPGRQAMPGNLLQTILIGNAAGEEQVSYIDTQVKFSKSYFYSLFEYNALYNTQYEVLILDYEGPDLEGNSQSAWQDLEENKSEIVGDRPRRIMFDCYVIRRPHIEIMELPIYDRTFYDFNLSYSEYLYGGVSYPICTIRDYPPPPPHLQIYPLMGNPNQVKIVIDPTSGDYTAQSSLENLLVPTTASVINRQNVRAHQLRFAPSGRSNWFSNRVACRGEGGREVTKMQIYRTSQINQFPTNLQDVYDSFSPENNPSAVRGTMVNMLYNPNAELEEGESAVVSYDTVDTIQSNQNYYYTAVATDFHGNVSVPSPIYRVRLISENGLLLPEVEIYEPKFLKPQTPSKKFARFIQIKASGIQAFPFAETNNDGETTILRSLGSSRSSAITENSFVLRLTSRDTGKKFDLHLSFDNQDTPINDEDE